MLMASHQNTGQDRMGLRAAIGAVATIGFSNDHARTQLAFGQVVGGIQFIHVQET